MKKVISVVSLVIILLVSSSCASSKKPILIGLVNTFEEFNGSLAYDSLYAVEMAINKVNESGGIKGRQLELVLRNDQGDPSIALQIGRELADMGVVAIIGHGLSSVFESIITVAEERNLIYISPTIATDVSGEIDDNFVRIIPSTCQQGIALAGLVNDVHLDDTFIVYERTNMAFSSSVVRSFVDELETFGVLENPSMQVMFSRGDQMQYVNAISQFNASGLSNILMIGSSYDIGIMVQLIEDRPNKNVFLPLWPSTNDIFSLSGQAIEGAYSIGFIDYNSDNPVFLDFNEAYYEEYGVDPSFSSYFSYEAAMVLIKALENADSFATESIMSQIKNSNVTGLVNDFTINEYGDAIRQIYRFKLVGNSFERYDNEEE